MDFQIASEHGSVFAQWPFEIIVNATLSAQLVRTLAKQSTMAKPDS